MDAKSLIRKQFSTGKSRQLMEKWASEGVSFKVEPKISGIQSRPDFIIRDEEGRELIVELKEGKARLEDIAKIVAIRKSHPVRACLVTAGGLTEDARLAAQKYGVAIVDWDQLVSSQVALPTFVPPLPGLPPESPLPPLPPLQPT